ncbi:hypothetical protein D7X96_12000 [Corallococcus interemptor]|uniref:Uncharacterized protein n=1 Tax=Corallococcus interemptor TaxID=2316720 RepID=A0A3A8QN98_9BACT|nr:hypothetical protein [Corallococcus interemptor]RKH50471.1 hypothetical protein D7Y23_13100 [Corallococcus sp. AB050B]RKH70236.1 hypothetical protein D7X96_12000 [Corallococcus interemptor]
MAAQRKRIQAAWVVVAMLLAGGAVAHGSRLPPPGSAVGQKVCSAVVPDSWRDSINVPASWTPRTCADWAHSEGAVHYQLGCFYEARRNAPAFV